MKTRVKEIKHKKLTAYIPQVKWLFWWYDITPDIDYNSLKKAKKAIDYFYTKSDIIIPPH